MAVNLQEIANTQDEGLPVFKVDTEKDSFLTLMFPGNGRMRVHHINSKNAGEMKRMMNYAVKTFGVEEVEFFNVMGKRLPQKVEGFEKRQVYVPDIKETVDILVGEWKLQE